MFLFHWDLFENNCRFVFRISDCAQMMCLVIPKFPDEIVPKARVFAV